jgi:alkaline phosphatase D
MTQVHRRKLLQAGLAAGAAVPVFGISGPAFAASRPELTHGVQSGDATPDSAMVWTRADRPSRMWVTVSNDPSFKNPRLVRGPALTPDTDFTGKVRVPGLVPGARTYYRVHAEDLDSGQRSEPLTESLRTAPVRAGTIRFLWSGWQRGSNENTNGLLRQYPAVRRVDPPALAGDVAAKTKVAETLDDFRVTRDAAGRTGVAQPRHPGLGERSVGVHGVAAVQWWSAVWTDRSVPLGK